MNFNNVKIIAELFVNNIKYIEELSPFLAEQILDKWKNYTLNFGNTKGNRYFKSIYNSLNKLDILEKKKSLNIEKIKKNNIQYISMHCLNKKHRNYLIDKINSVCSLFDLYNLILNEYDKNNFKVDIKMNDTKAKSIHYIKDNEGYIYANMYYCNKIMKFSKKSFTYENMLFNDCVLNNKELVFDALEGSLSTFERKRRIYIFRMLDICRWLNNIKNKQFDIGYPINGYYKYASIIVSSLYEEIFDNNSSNSTLDYLRQKTIEAYGCKKALSLYEEDFWLLVKAIPDLNRDVLEEYVNIANFEKVKKNNIGFVSIENLIPSILDIYQSFNNLVMVNVENNYNYYMEDIESRINMSLKYMSVKEIIEFNNNFKKCLRKNHANINTYKLVQKVIVRLIVNRNGMDALEVINEVLKEDVLI